jgi:steroid delta-isomerase-like uncharacterized protein
MKTRPKKSSATKSRPNARRAAPKRPPITRSPKASARKVTARKITATRGPTIKALAARWFEELWNRKNSGALQDLMAPGATGDTEGGTVTGHADFVEKLHRPLVGAFPDLRVTIDGIVAEDNDAVVRWTLRATHGGDALGMPASNRRVALGGMTWLQFKDGKVVAGWDRWNATGLMAYLKDGAECATVRAC